MKQEFKAGDLVYYPKESAKIHTIRSRNSESYQLVIEGDSFVHSFTLHGHYYADSQLPSIFHATHENHELLCKLYGVEFEAPPKSKSPKEIIRLMKKAGHKFILCNAKDHNSDQWETVVAFGISSYCSPTSSSDYMHDSFGSSYFEFYPINSKGQKIIDFVDGEIVTE